MTATYQHSDINYSYQQGEDEHGARVMQTFAEFCREWLLANSSKIQPCHYIEIEQIVNNYLYPTFGDQPLLVIFDFEIPAFYETLKKQVLFPLQLARIMFLLREIFDAMAEACDFAPFVFPDVLDPILELAIRTRAERMAVSWSYTSEESNPVDDLL